MPRISIGESTGKAKPAGYPCLFSLLEMPFSVWSPYYLLHVFFWTIIREKKHGSEFRMTKIYIWVVRKSLHVVYLIFHQNTHFWFVKCHCFQIIGLYTNANWGWLVLSLTPHCTSLEMSFLKKVGPGIFMGILPATPNLPGWWFQPIWKILVKLEIFPK